MSQLPSMPMWWGDFFSKTDHLSNAEQWAYAKLLAKTWLRNCRPFPDNDKDIARLLGLSLAQWLKIRPRIEPFFDLSDNTWRQKRLEEEFIFVSERAENSRRNGAKGGRPQSNKNNGIENPAGLQQANPKPTQNEPTYTYNKKEGSVGSDEPTAAEAAPKPDLSIVAGIDFMSDAALRTEIYRAGKEILGQKAGGQITKLIECHAGNLHETLDTLRLAQRKENPREYVAAIVRGQPPDTDWDAVYRRMGVQ